MAAWRGLESFSLAISWLASGRESLQTSPCLSKVKGLFEALKELNGRLNREALRVKRPMHSVFLCGGFISPDPKSKSASSVRDYLIRLRQAEKKIKGKVVLAETAQQLYRDTNYPDLISFEEDVARVASIVLVISESAGSLAELGAFASEPVIRPALRIILSEEHHQAESFVRFGPVKRVERDNRDHIGVFPWKTHRINNQLVKSSISNHYSEIVKFINDRISEIPKSFLYSTLNDRAIFYDIIWLLSLLEAVPPVQLYDAVRIIHPDAQDVDIRDKLYILKTIGWINSFAYSNKDYYYLPENSDPYEYAFLDGKRARNVAAIKLDISAEFKKDANISRPVIKRLQEHRNKNS